MRGIAVTLLANSETKLSTDRQQNSVLITAVSSSGAAKRT